MSKVARVVYFNITGLGEPIRFLLSYCNQEFIDERLTREQFEERKNEFPFGKLPYVEIDGMSLHQSISVCRYLAQKYDLAGKTKEDSLKCDIIVDTLNDVRAGLVSFFWDEDEKSKEQKKQKTMKETHFYLDRLEQIVTENDGHFVNGQLTWPDLIFASLSSFLNYMAGEDLYETRPSLKTLRNRVMELPGIVKYLANRPAFPF